MITYGILLLGFKYGPGFVALAEESLQRVPLSIGLVYHLIPSLAPDRNPLLGACPHMTDRHVCICSCGICTSSLKSMHMPGPSPGLPWPLEEKATTADSTAFIRWDMSGSLSVANEQSELLWEELRQK